MNLVTMPGTQEAIDAAYKSGNYDSVILASFMVGLMAFFAFIIKWILKGSTDREKRLADRITTLETFVETTLVQLIRDCSSQISANIEAFRALTSSLHIRPCLLDDEGENCLVDRVEADMANRAAGILADKIRVIEK